MDANGYFYLASLAYATYLGGHTANLGDFISGITIDNAGNAYIVGYANSADFPVTSGAYQTVCGVNGRECTGAHVTKLNPAGSAILWSTFVGDAKSDGSDALFFTGPIQLDGRGNVYIMGQAAGGFPLVNPVETAGNGGDMQVLVAELDPTGANLLFSTSIGSGGLSTSSPAGLAVDSAGDIYLAGNNLGPSLITTPGAFQTTASYNPSRCSHGFVAKITPGGPANHGRQRVQCRYASDGRDCPQRVHFHKRRRPRPGNRGRFQYDHATGGRQRLIGGTAAYLTYAQDGQINALAPFGAGGAQTTIQVEVNGVMSNSVIVPIVGASPGIFTQAYGPGQAWMVNQDSTFNSSSNPAARGTYVAFWITGQGYVNAPPPDGIQPTGPPFPTPVLPVSVSLGGVPLPAANVVFDGLVYSGEVQINVLIPATLPPAVRSHWSLPLAGRLPGRTPRSPYSKKPPLGTRCAAAPTPHGAKAAWRDRHAPYRLRSPPPCVARIIFPHRAMLKSSSSSGSTGTTAMCRPAISSVELGPHTTRRGGCFGLRGLSAELS